MPFPVKQLCHLHFRAGLETIPRDPATRDMTRVPVQKLLLHVLQPSPDPLRRGVDQDLVLQFNGHGDLQA